MGIIAPLKKKNFSIWFLILPFLPISIMTFSAIRHFVFGLTSCFLILGISLYDDQKEKINNYFFRILNYIGVFTLLIISAWLISQSRATAFESNMAIPRESIKYLKTNKLNGRMFNEVAMGGYFIYYLYPQYQVFFDGRADIYHCCEMRDFWQIVINKDSSRETFRKVLYGFLDKYKFSYLVLSVADYNPLAFTSSSLIADTLSDDSNWRLVYFSDNVEILLKNDGKNTELFNNLGINAASPNKLIAYRKGQESIAENEYIRMIKIQDSGLARNALGEIYMQKGQFDRAKIEFKSSTKLNSRFGKPYLNLGIISLKQKQILQAKIFFQRSLEISPYLGDSYLNLAKIYLDSGQTNLANSILNKGLKEKIDLLSRQKIIFMLQNLRIKEQM
jgi:tetratricopeptide (TPR) repeat protein